MNAEIEDQLQLDLTTKRPPFLTLSLLVMLALGPFRNRRGANQSNLLGLGVRLELEENSITLLFFFWFFPPR